jgi:predicted MFS family arabinose efflux permease
VNFFNLMLHALYVLYLTRELGLSAAVIGGILSAGAVGGFLGAIVAPRVGLRLGAGPSTLVGCVLFTAPLILIPLAGGSTALVVATLTVSEVLSTVGVMIFDVNLMSLKLVVTPHALRARTYGAWRAVNFGVRPLGAVAGGVIGTAIGLRPALWIATLGAVVGALWVWFSPLRSLREPPPEPQD